MVLLIIKVVIGVSAALIGSLVGIRRALYITIGGIGGFAAISTVKGLHKKITPWFETFTNHLNSVVISVILLTLIPMTTILYIGRRLIVQFAFTENTSEVIDRILGGAYTSSIYIIVLVVIQGG